MHTITTQYSLLSHLFHSPSKSAPHHSFSKKVIRQELKDLALKKWPNSYILGFIPIHNYRLRRRVKREVITWWIEHDIPPYDLYRCAAYQVELKGVNSSKQYLIVRSGTSSYAVQPMTPCALQAALERVLNDPPLHINRAFGKVIDP